MGRVNERTSVSRLSPREGPGAARLRGFQPVWREPGSEEYPLTPSARQRLRPFPEEGVCSFDGISLLVGVAQLHNTLRQVCVQGKRGQQSVKGRARVDREHLPDRRHV